MVEIADNAPNFVAPVVDRTGEIEPFTFSDHLNEAPIVLVFFQGAFTESSEDVMRAFQDRHDAIKEAGGTIYGVSVDTPFSLREFRTRLGLDFGFLSDHRKRIIDKYDVRMDRKEIGYYGLAERAVFVVNSANTVSYAWRTADPELQPTYEEIIDVVESTN